MLVNSAQHIVVWESLLAYVRCCRPLMKRRKPISAIARICPHRMCRCGRDGNESKRMKEDIVRGLRDIVRKRKEEQEVVTLSSLMRNHEKSKVVKDVLRVMSYEVVMNNSGEGPKF